MDTDYPYDPVGALHRCREHFMVLDLWLLRACRHSAELNGPDIYQVRSLLISRM